MSDRKPPSSSRRAKETTILGCGGSSAGTFRPRDDRRHTEHPGTARPGMDGDTESDDGSSSTSSRANERGFLSSVAVVGRLLLHPFGGGLRRRGDGSWLGASAKQQDTGKVSAGLRVVVPGLCGLNNMGNTCFMNAAFQCLLHTPLLASYMISGRYRDDVNRDNRLGYRGAVAEEVAHLMYQMWLGRFRAVTPQSLKRCVNATKPIFSGHEQHDAQEFLLELLDALHEDLNANAGKVPPSTSPAAADHADRKTESAEGLTVSERRQRTYSTIGPSLEDDVATSLTTTELAAYFWDRHRSQNSSVITRLVQGQLRSEVRCPSCSHVSRTFDPFSCISVPLPKDQAERIVTVVTFRRMPWLFKSTNEYSRLIALGDLSVDTVVDSYVAMHRNRRVAVRSCLTMSRLHEVRDLKAAVCKKLVKCAEQFNEKKEIVVRSENINGTYQEMVGCDETGQISNKQIVLFEYKNMQLTKFLDDRSPLSVLDMIGSSQDPRCNGCYAYESGTDLDFVMSAPVEQFSRPGQGGEDNSSSSASTIWETDSSTVALSADEASNISNKLTKLWFEPTDRVEYASHKTFSVHNLDLVVDLPNVTSNPLFASRRHELNGKSYTSSMGLSVWPTDFIALLQFLRECPPYFFRLDAYRSKNSWCSGSVITSYIDDLSSSVDKNVFKGRESFLRVHFDGYASSSDENFTELDFIKGRLAPLYSQTKRLLTLFEVRITMRRYIALRAPPSTSEIDGCTMGRVDAADRMDLSKVPVSAAIDRILGRNNTFHRPSELSPNTSKDTESQCQGEKVEEVVKGTENITEETAEIKLMNDMKDRASFFDGMEPVPDSETFVCQLESFKSCECAFRHIVEQVASRYLTDKELTEFIHSGLSATINNREDPWGRGIIWDRLPFNIRIVMSGHYKGKVYNHELGYSGDLENTIWENTIFPRDECRPLSNLYHGTFAVTVDWKKTAFSDLETRSLAYTSDDEFEKLIKRHNQLQTPPDSLRGVTLLDCLRSYASDEVFDDGSWYCSPCKVHRPGVMRAWFFRLPDVLIIHIKRFNMTARWREKIRTKVCFPLNGLDMTEFMADNYGSKDTEGNASEAIQRMDDSNNNLYDLYSVVNHMGGMSGGHYTAAVRYYGHPMSTYPIVEEGSKNSNPTAKVHIDTMPNHDSPDDNAGSPVIAVGAIKLNVSDPSVGSRSSVLCAGADDSARAVGRDKDGASSNKQRARHPQSTRSSHSVSAMLKNIIGCQSIEGVTFDNGTELFDILPDLQQKAVKGCIGQWFLLDDETCIPIPEERVVSGAVRIQRVPDTCRLTRIVFSSQQMRMFFFTEGEL